MRSLKPPIVALAALASVAAQAQQVSPDQLRESLVPYASSADSVTLPDGRKVGFTCMGEGSPTVILIAGMGDFAGMAWANVQPEMAKTTKVCAWDRPGWGFSDGAEGRHTVASSTAALEAALATGAIPGPYVMVGHSLGGLESLLLADRRPDAVVGMVLVDPSVPNQDRLVEQVSPALGAGNPEEQPAIRGLRQCAAGIRQAADRGEEPPSQCFAYPPYFPPALSAAFAAKVRNPIQYETQASFLTNTDHFALAANPVRNYGDMPLVVLTATGRAPPSGETADAQAQRAVFTQALDRAHDELAALSSRGRKIPVGAGHYIQRSKPQVVIDAVETVVAEARAAAGN